MEHAETVESIVSMVGGISLIVAMLVFVVSISFAMPREQTIRQAVAAAARRSERWAARTALWLGLLLLTLYAVLSGTTDWTSWSAFAAVATVVVISACSAMLQIRDRRCG